MKKRELAMLKEEFARKSKDNLESLKALDRKKEVLIKFKLIKVSFTSTINVASSS